MNEWGGYTYACIWEHRNDLWIFTKLGRDEVLMIPHQWCCFSARSGSRAGQKIGHGGPLLQRISSSDRKATATNRMHNNALAACGMKYCYFWFHSEVKCLTRFNIFLLYFNAISVDFYAVKCLIYIYFV